MADEILVNHLNYSFFYHLFLHLLSIEFYYLPRVVSPFVSIFHIHFHFHLKIVQNELA